MQICIEFLHTHTCVIEMSVKPFLVLYSGDSGIYHHVGRPQYCKWASSWRAISHVKVVEQNDLFIHDRLIDLSLLGKTNVYSHLFGSFVIALCTSLRSLIRFKSAPIKSRDGDPNQRTFRKLPTSTRAPAPFET